MREQRDRVIKCWSSQYDVQCKFETVTFFLNSVVNYLYDNSLYALQFQKTTVTNCNKL